LAIDRFEKEKKKHGEADIDVEKQEVGKGGMGGGEVSMTSKGGQKKRGHTSNKGGGRKIRKKKGQSSEEGYQATMLNNEVLILEHQGVGEKDRRRQIADSISREKVNFWVFKRL
jgi:hypothetical protein